MIPSLDEIEVERIHKVSDADKKAEKRSVNVDMNPMVDLAFLLLTFFMLATTFSKPQAMELLVPAKPKPDDVEKEMPVKESKTLSLVLTKDKLVWYVGITDPDIDSLTYNQPEVIQMLEARNKAVSDMVVLIKPLKESNYGQLVMLIDALNYAGVGRYAISDLSAFDRALATEETAADGE
jgi:biopolymer transport protein ExbD